MRRRSCNHFCLAAQMPLLFIIDCASQVAVERPSTGSDLARAGPPAISAVLGCYGRPDMAPKERSSRLLTRNGTLGSVNMLLYWFYPV